MWLKCPSCSYIWNYQGRSAKATCPKCKRKINISQWGYLFYIHTVTADYHFIYDHRKSELIVQKVTEDELEENRIPAKISEVKKAIMQEIEKIINEFL